MGRLKGETSDTDKKGIVAYLLIAFGLAWLLWEIALRIGPSVDRPLFQFAILPGALAPAVATIVVRKWITREGFGDAGLGLNLRRWRYHLVGWALPLLVVLAIVLLAVTLGIRNPYFTLERALRELTPEGTALPSLPSGFFVILPFQLMFTALVVTPILWGEEFGWRGYLQVRLLARRPLLAAVVTGLIWGLWHIPINLRGYNFANDVGG